ncbi:MAG: hypothetical protein OEV37_00450 [Candidatus Berkelbacteria bacterium]|nr:hypothetical protein [Candidatus Berkelbacteria bacterium]
MNIKTFFITLASTFVVVALIAILSFLVWSNQPTADVSSPPVPPAPETASADFPPVPAEPRIKGDTTDDGIVNVLDINGLIAHWRENNKDYDLVSEAGTDTSILNALDLAQVIKFWRCLETKEGCEYRQ